MIDDKTREADRNTMVALLMVASVVTLLLGMMAVILPNILGIVVIVAGLGWFGVMHYALWGWWLGPYLKRMDHEDDRNNP